MNGAEGDFPGPGGPDAGSADQSGPGVVRVGLLHTVPALAGTFQASIAAADPALEPVHIADPWLLARAIATGADAAVRDRVAGHIGYLISAGARAVLVTCSSIGEAVEAAAASAAVPVLRVDGPVAREAAARADQAGRAAGRSGRIAVLATLAATLGPTGRLIARAVAAAAADVTVTADVVEGAAAARAAGDQAVHDLLIAQAVDAATQTADVVVLAQASMAEAVTGTPAAVPVLTSPPGGVAALLAAVTGSGPAGSGRARAAGR